MRAVVQRVTKSKVCVGEKIISEISKGYNVLLGIEKTDTLEDANYIADKLVNLRIFSDNNDKLNLSILDVKGEILLISQFTLLADARKGRRPGFSSAMSFDEGEILYNYVKEKITSMGVRVLLGVYGADMQVSILNDGPVTILLDSKKQF